MCLAVAPPEATVAPADMHGIRWRCCLRRISGEEPPQIVKARSGALERVSRLVVLDEEVLQPRLVGAGEDPAMPVADASAFGSWTGSVWKKRKSTSIKSPRSGTRRSTAHVRALRLVAGNVAEVRWQIDEDFDGEEECADVFPGLRLASLDQWGHKHIRLAVT